MKKRENVWEAELLDNIIFRKNDLEFWNCPDFEELIEEIEEAEAFEEVTA